MGSGFVKRSMKGKFTFLVLGALLVTAPLAFSPEPAQKGRWVTVTVHRVKEINNLDEDFPRKDQADFFARITIGSKSTRTQNLSKDDAWPNWKVRAWATGNSVPIHLRIMDDDGGMEEKDDQVDICPKIGEKTLVMNYNVKTGRISGDASGRRGQRIHTRGGGSDTDKAEIWFSVR